MPEKEDAVLLGPCVGELYWEGARFAPMLPYMIRNQYKNKLVKYIVLTREDRFDLYGKFADILVPLRIEGDYTEKKPECFRLIGLDNEKYQEIAMSFKEQYSQRFNIIKHLYPDIKKPAFVNKNQFPPKLMTYMYKPRQENYDLVNQYLPSDKPIIVLGSRYRNGFKRNWSKWQEFYDILFKQTDLMSEYNFIICGKKGEYVPDKYSRFYDMNNIQVGKKSSLVGILLVILERAYFCFGSQSSIPNFALLYKVEVLEFGCQKTLHTRTYNVKNTPITFIENKSYDINPNVILKNLKELLKRKRKQEKKKEKING